jgi:hypothetical protein
MQSKIDNLFGTNADEVKSEGGDTPFDLKSHFEKEEFDIYYSFGGEPLFLKYPSDKTIEFSEDQIKLIQRTQDKRICLLFTFYSASTSKIDLKFSYTFT